MSATGGPTSQSGSNTNSTMSTDEVAISTRTSLDDDRGTVWVPVQCSVPHLCRTRMKNRVKRRERLRDRERGRISSFPWCYLAYSRFFLVGGLWARQDLNLQPTDYESAALTRLSYEPDCIRLLAPGRLATHALRRTGATSEANASTCPGRSSPFGQNTKVSTPLPATSRSSSIILEAGPTNRSPASGEIAPMTL